MPNARLGKFPQHWILTFRFLRLRETISLHCIDLIWFPKVMKTRRWLTRIPTCGCRRRYTFAWKKRELINKRYFPNSFSMLFRVCFRIYVLIIIWNNNFLAPWFYGCLKLKLKFTCCRSFSILTTDCPVTFQTTNLVLIFHDKYIIRSAVT